MDHDADAADWGLAVGQINNLAASSIPEILRRLRALESASNMNSSAVGRGGIRVHGGGGITIENGGLNVSGTATISGVLEASGTINMTGTFTATGDVNLNGPVDIAGDVTSTGHFTQTGPTDLNGTTTVAGDTTVTGDFTVNGPMKTTGTLDVEGVTTLKNDLNVSSGGKIKAGVTEIHPAGNISFGPSLQITPDNGSGSAAIQNGASEIILTPSNPDYWAQFSGGAYFQGLVRAAALRLSSLPTTTEPANLYIDGAGKVYRSTA